MKHRFLTKALAFAVCLAMIAGAVFAAPWYLEDGSITVDTSTGKQMVSQGGGAATEDGEAVITQRAPGTETSNTVTITGDGEANVTIQDVNINTGDASGIDIQGNTTANITAEGDNIIKSNSGDAAVHVGSGDLNLNTTEGSKVTASVDNSGTTASNTGAGIGSNKGEDMSGSINLSGKGSVDASSKNGAGIGSGKDGNLSGTITTGEGSVTASSGKDGAGIGSGYLGEMCGTITTGSGDVTASASDGAGIGSGWGGEMSGTITTGSGNVTASSSKWGAGIGAGNYGDMTGTITTGTGTVTASTGTMDPVTGEYTDYTNPGGVTYPMGLGAAIGSGAFHNMSGTVTIGPGKVILNTNRGAGIGVGVINSNMNSIPQMSGTVNIQKGADLTIDSRVGNQIGIGAPMIIGSIEYPGYGAVTSEARLNVEPGSILQGKNIQSLQDIHGLELGIPDSQVVLVNVPSDKVPGAVASDALTLTEWPTYWVLSGGSAMECEEALENGVLTITAEAEEAQLHITGFGLQQLQSQGIQTVVFRTASQESRFEIAAVLGCSQLVLSHEGSKAELTLDGEASDLLK